MRLQPRAEILRLWRALARPCFRDGMFVWSGDGNPISDAEQLLCVLLPATELRSLVLDRLDETREDAADALAEIGDLVQIPLRLIRSLTEYMTRYADADGRPVFHAGDYLDLTAAGIEAQPPDVVESFAVSVHLTLATIGFCRVLRPAVTRDSLMADVNRLESLAGVRLTAALVGLLRGFAVHVFDDGSPAGQRLRETIRQDHRSDTVVLDEYRRGLREIRAGVRDVTIAVTFDPDALSRKDFECGWAWAVVADMPSIAFVDESVPQRIGWAPAVPHLYFTHIALEAVAALYSQRSRVLGLLHDLQARLAVALQLRSTLAQAYWSYVATFGDHRWPLERLPWRTFDGDASDYHSLVLAMITMAEIGGRQGNNDISLGYAGRVLHRIAARQRIVRPPYADGAAAGVSMAYEPASVALATGSAAGYRIAGRTPMLLSAAVRAAAATDNSQLRQEFEDLADLIWDHMAGDPAKPVDLTAFGDGTSPDWRNLLRVVEALTAAEKHVDGGVQGSTGPPELAHQLLAACDQTVDDLAATAAVDSPAWPRIEQGLARARSIVDHHPARAAALLYQVLATLDGLIQDHDSAADHHHRRAG